MFHNQSYERYTKLLIKLLLISFSLISVFYTSTVYAAVPTLDQVIANLSTHISALMEMVTGFAYVMGIYLVIKGVMELKRFGESRTMMSSEHGLKKPLILLFVGAALVFLPSSINTGLTTLWTEPNLLAYVPEERNAWSQLIANSFIILQFIGVIAFIRGLLKISHLGGQGGGQPGQFGSAMTHIIGGILCINMYDTVNMIITTLGLNNPFT